MAGSLIIAPPAIGYAMNSFDTSAAQETRALPPGAMTDGVMGDNGGDDVNDAGPPPDADTINDNDAEAANINDNQWVPNDNDDGIDNDNVSAANPIYYPPSSPPSAPNDDPNNNNPNKATSDLWETL